MMLIFRRRDVTDRTNRVHHNRTTVPPDRRRYYRTSEALHGQAESSFEPQANFHRISNAWLSFVIRSRPPSRTFCRLAGGYDKAQDATQTDRGR